MKLHQLIAVQGSVKGRVTNAVTVITKRLGKSALYNGQRITYTPLDEKDVAAHKPPEGGKVQFYVKDELDSMRTLLSELYDINATRDWANMQATGTVTVDGVPLLADAPVPFLLFLKLELQRLRSDFSSLPVLDTSEDWVEDEATGGFKTEPKWQHSSRRVRKAFELSKATERHAANVQMVEDEVPVARKETTNFSGAMRPKDREALVRRVDKLLDAVSVAVEEANSMEVERQHVAEPIWAYLLSS